MRHFDRSKYDDTFIDPELLEIQERILSGDPDPFRKPILEASTTDSTTDIHSIGSLKALVCENCGGALDKHSLTCQFCGVQHAYEKNKGA